MAVLPGLGSADPRVRADPHTAPWSAVARLQVAGVSRCTAVMVAPELAATAAHCLFNKALGRVVPIGSVHLLFGYDTGSYSRHAVPVAVRFAAGADPSGQQAVASDLALLQLAGPVRDVLRPASAPIVAGTALQMGGYGQDRAQRLAIDPACTALGSVRDKAGGAMLRHDCSGTRGTSGGPVIVRDGEGWALAGIQVAAEREGAGGVAVPAAAVLRLMEAAR